jgi:hypothetical protein
MMRVLTDRWCESRWGGAYQIGGIVSPKQQQIRLWGSHMRGQHCSQTNTIWVLPFVALARTAMLILVLATVVYDLLMLIATIATC